MSDLYFGTGIPLSASFDLGSPRPLDSRSVVQDMDELNAIPEGRKYEGLSVYVKDASKKYTWTGSAFAEDVSLGLKGDDGAAATIAVGTITVGDPGTDATIINSGTDNAAVFNFSIPKSAGLYTTTQALAGTHIASLTTITPIGYAVGDTILDSAGDLWSITEITETQITVNTTVIANLKGIDGVNGIDGAKGEPGDSFKIAKTFASIDLMNADFDNTDVAEGGFVMITSNQNDDDNAKLYVKGATEYTFITDLSGADGVKGDAGTCTLGTVATGLPGTNVLITNTGSTSEAIFNFTIPRGAPATVSVGTVITGETLAITNSGTTQDAIFDFVIPVGADGAAGADGIDGDQIKTGDTYDVATNATLFFKTVRTIVDTSDTESAVGYAQVDNAPVA